MYARLFLLLVLPCALGLHAEVGRGKIFIWLPATSIGHYETFKPLLHELARRGHELSVITSMLDDDLCSMKGVECGHAGVDLSTQKPILPDHLMKKRTNILESSGGGIDFSFEAMKEAVNHDIIKKHREAGTKFDVILLYAFCDAGLYLARRVFDAPVIYLVPSMRMHVVEVALSNPTNPAYIPNLTTGFGADMNFLERTVNTLVTFGVKFYQDMQCKYSLEPEAKKMLSHNEGDLNLIDLLYNEASFALKNGHPVFGDVYPNNPNSALIAGLHTRHADKIAYTTIREWLEGAKDGLILVSFAREHSTSIANDQLQVLFNIFSELPQRVLIEWHGGDIAAKPKNVLVRKQLPRQDILGHPNTMLLVSHGSMADVTEAIFHGRPLLSMPIQGEELSNADRIVKIGLGEVLQWPQLTEETLKSKLEVLLTYNNYTIRTEKLSAQFRDDFMTPLEKAVYHVEYVMRYRGAPFLQQSYGKHLYWYEYLMLDVAAVFLLLAVVAAYLSWECVQCCFKACCGRFRHRNTTLDDDKKRK